MDRFNAATDEQRGKLWQLEDQLAGIYASTFRRAGKLAASRFKTMSLPQPVLAAGVPTPGWVPPDPEELVTREELRQLSQKRLEHLWKRAVTLALLSYSDRFDVAFNVLNPFAAELLLSIGSRDSMVWEAYRDEINKTIGESYEEGKSVPDAARAIRENVAGLKNSTAKMVARTDLNALSNGSSIAAATALGEAAPKYKMWLSAGDDKVRPDHVEANRQVVPTSQPFKVGVEELMFPGDPTASDSEVCNCRCTLVYTDEHGVVAAGYDESKHPRHAKGTKEGGRYAPKPEAPAQERVDKLVEHGVTFPEEIGMTLADEDEAAFPGSWEELGFDRNAVISEYAAEAEANTKVIEANTPSAVSRWEAASSSQTSEADQLAEMWKQGGGENDYYSDPYRVWADMQFNNGGEATLQADWQKGWTWGEDVAAVDKAIYSSQPLRDDVAVWRGATGGVGEPSSRPISTSFERGIAMSYADRTGRGNTADLKRVLVPAGSHVGWDPAESEVVLPSGTVLEPVEGDLVIAVVPPERVDQPITSAAWDESKHPREQRGTKGGGRFRTSVVTEYPDDVIDEVMGWENESAVDHAGKVGRVNRNRVLEWTPEEAREFSLTAAAVEFTNGSMVALYPHHDQALMLEQPDGQPADELHITLCHLPNGWDGDKGKAMTGLVEAASVWGRLEGTVTGVSCFPEGDDGVPWIAIPNVRSLNDLRDVVATVLEDAGVTISNDYEFTPHLTLGYDVEPTRDVTGVPLTFTAISAVDGPERVNIPLEPELTAAGWDETKHPRDPGGEGGGRWVRAGDLASDDFRPEEQTTSRDELIDQFQAVQSMWDTESRGALEQYVQHEMTDEEYQSYSIQDEKAANKGVVQDRIAAKLEGDPDFLSLHDKVFGGGGTFTFEDWKSEFEPGGEFPTANTPEKQVSAMMVSAWARSSSDTDPISLQLQEAAVEEFGLEGHTSFHVEALDEMKSLYEGSSHSPIWNDQQKAGARKFLRAQYDLTQEMFKRHGISEVTLYRGMAWGPADYEKAGRPVPLGTTGEITRVRTNPLSSYSYSFDTAVGFASKYDIQAVLGTKVDVKRILSTPFTGAGCLSEGEMVVIGGDDTDGFVVSWALSRMDPDTGEVKPAVGEIVNQADLFDDKWMDAIDGKNRSRA